MPINDHLIVTVHGIRTFGGWQESLEDIIKSESNTDNIQFVNYKFGYFSIAAFLLPPLRWLVVRRFRHDLLALCKHKRSRVDLVGHSFGTHIIAWALMGLKENDGLHIHTLILSGSVLRSNFPWRSLLGQRIRRVINDCGSKDKILFLSQFWVLFTGMAGRSGFIGATSDVFRNRYSEFGHSGYFVDNNQNPDLTYMRDNWVPLLTADLPIKMFDKRGKLNPLDGLLITLGNNAEPLKIAIYLAPFIIVALWMYEQKNQALSAALRLKAQSQHLLGSYDSALEFAIAAERTSSSAESRTFISNELRIMAPLIASSDTIFDGIPKTIAAAPDNVSGIVSTHYNDFIKFSISETSIDHQVLDRGRLGVIDIMSASPDGRHILASTQGGLRILDILSETSAVSLKFTYNKIDASSLSLDGKFVVIASDKDITVYSTSTSKKFGSSFKYERSNMNGFRSIKDVRVSRDGRLVVYSTGESLVEVDVIENKATLLFRSSSGIRSLTAAPNSRRYAITTEEGVYAFLNNMSATLVSRTPQRSGAPLAFDPTGNFLAYSNHEAGVVVTDILSKAEVARTSQLTSVGQLVFSANGKLLYVAGFRSPNDNVIIQIWNLEGASAYTEAMKRRDGTLSAILVSKSNEVVWFDRKSKVILLEDEFGKIIQKANAPIGTDAIYLTEPGKSISTQIGREIVNWTLPELKPSNSIQIPNGWNGIVFGFEKLFLAKIAGGFMSEGYYSRSFSQQDVDNWMNVSSSKSLEIFDFKRNRIGIWNISNDDQRVLSVSNSGKYLITIVELANDNEIPHSSLYSNGSTLQFYRPDGSSFSIGGVDYDAPIQFDDLEQYFYLYSRGVLNKYDIRTGIAVFRKPISGLRNPSIDPGGRWIADVGDQIRIFDTSTSSILFETRYTDNLGGAPLKFSWSETDLRVIGESISKIAIKQKIVDIACDHLLNVNRDRSRYVDISNILVEACPSSTLKNMYKYINFDWIMRYFYKISNQFNIVKNDISN